MSKMAARLTALGMVLCWLSSAPAARAATAKEHLPESNASLLDRALIASARQLVGRAPLAAGTRIALGRGEATPLDQSVERALLAALTERRMDVWVVSASGETSAVQSNLPSAHMPPGQGFDSLVAEMRARRLEQAKQNASGEVFDPGTGSSGEGSTPQTSDMPLLTFHVEEARVDYPRLFRSGLFGGLHVERRALARLSGRLARSGSRAVYWVGVADTSIADHVGRSEVRMLEDPARPETRGTMPPQGWKKLAEPVLVIGLVAGLVSLFYTNRP